jgi:hypothetical protein
MNSRFSIARLLSLTSVTTERIMPSESGILRRFAAFSKSARSFSNHATALRKIWSRLLGTISSFSYCFLSPERVKTRLLISDESLCSSLFHSLLHVLAEEDPFFDG